MRRGYLGSRKIFLLELGLALFIFGVATMSHNSGAGQAPLRGSSLQAVNKIVGTDQTGSVTESYREGIPIKINIPSVGVDLDVIPGFYSPSNKTWTLSLVKAQYVAMLGPTNNTHGETFIYGHNRSQVFADILNIKPGAIAQVTTDNGYRFTYTYRDSITVTPENTSILGYKGPPVLVVQTCSGSAFQNRQLFIFNLTGVS